MAGWLASRGYICGHDGSHKRVAMNYSLMDITNIDRCYRATSCRKSVVIATGSHRSRVFPKRRRPLLPQDTFIPLRNSPRKVSRLSVRLFYDRVYYPAATGHPRVQADCDFNWAFFSSIGIAIIRKIVKVIPSRKGS